MATLTLGAQIHARYASLERRWRQDTAAAAAAVQARDGEIASLRRLVAELRANAAADTEAYLLTEQQHQANLHAAVVQRLLASELAAKLKAQLEEARREASDAAGAAASRDEEAVVRCVAAYARPTRCG